MSQQLTLANSTATRSLGIILGQQLPVGTVLLLQGNLGSGKTTLVQGLGVGLGIADAIDSPTFTLVNEYLQGRLPLYHLDLYRLDSVEVAALHPEQFWEATEVEAGVVAIEWADRLPYRPPDYLWLQFAEPIQTGRQLAVTAVGNDHQTIWQRLVPHLSLFQPEQLPANSASGSKID